MTVYRIAYKQYSKTLEAPGFEGRWNGTGRKVLYTAESTSLAMLENMIRRKGTGFNNDYRMMIIDIPDQLAMTTITTSDIPEGWRDYKDYSACQNIGNEWYDNLNTPVLKVPSAVLPDANNYVINTSHPDFKMVKLIITVPFIPDDRIEDILKNYKKT